MTFRASRGEPWKRVGVATDEALAFLFEPPPAACILAGAVLVTVANAHGGNEARDDRCGAASTAG